MNFWPTCDKPAALGMAAKAGMGLTLGAAGTTAAGAARVLPAPAEHGGAKMPGRP